MKFCVINIETNRIVAQFMHYADAMIFLNARCGDEFTVQEL